MDTVTLYGERDWDDLRSMFGRYFAEDVGIGLTDSAADELVAEIVADSHRYRFWIWLLRVDGETAGFCIAQIDTPDNPWYLKPGWGFVREFTVEPAYRYAGRGRALQAFALARLAEEGARDIYLTAEESGGAPFWRACGFADSGEICARNHLPVFTKSLA